MFDRWFRTIVRGRIVVIALWLVIVVVGALSATNLSNLLSTSLAVPGTGSASADALLAAHFGDNIEGTFTVVLAFGDATTQHIDHDESSIAAAARSVPSAHVIEQRAIYGVLYVNVATELDLSSAAADTTILRTALAREGLSNALVTGPPALQHDVTPVLSGDLHRGEVIALLAALILLLVLLGWSWAVALPFIVAGATTAGSLAIVYVLAHHFLMVLYIPNVIELVGLGLAIDYSLLIVHRFRFEVAKEDVDVESAVIATMKTAGRTVVISGGTVAIGLATLLLVPVPFVRSLGAAGLIVPVVSVLAAVSLQPALLAVAGRAGVQPRGRFGLMAARDVLGGRWSRVARRVVSHPVRWLSGALVVLAACAVSLPWLQLTPASTTAVPSSLQSTRALALVSDHIGPGFATPTQIVIDLGRAHEAATHDASFATLALARRILAIQTNHESQVFAVAIGTKAPFVDPTGRYEQILVVGRDQFGAQSSQQLVAHLRDVIIPTAHFQRGVRIYVGGASAQGVDFLNSVYGVFPWIVFLALLIALVILARAFRSLPLAFVALLLDVMSISVSFGLLVVFFRFGVGTAIFGTYHVSQIEGWVPVFLFAMLFGLSMDYQVFLVTRMREARDAGASTSDAIVSGVARTGGVVSAAAIIFVAAVSGLVVGHIAGLQELGVGLGLGVLIDATLVRGVVLPCAMTLLGRWTWWLPQPLASALRTKASPPESRETRP